MGIRAVAQWIKAACSCKGKGLLIQQGCVESVRSLLRCSMCVQQ